jgi:uncharacterized membrane protein
MSNLVVIGFEDEHTAFEMRAELVKLQKEYLIEMEDVVVVTKDEKGKVKLHQAVNLTAVGAVGIGIDNNFIKELGETITPGSSALFVLVRKSTPDKVLEELKGFKGKILKTSLTADKEEALREALE